MHDILTNANLSKQFLEHVPAAVALFDDHLCCLDCSRRWRTDHGLDDHDVMGKSLGEVFPSIVPHWREVHRRALVGEMVSGTEETSRQADGTADRIEWKIVPWRDEAGKIGGAAVFTEVITDLMESRRRAGTLYTELNLLMRSAKRHAVCLLDPAGKIVIWNVGAERLYGWSADEVIGKPYGMMFVRADREAGLPQRQLALARDEGTSHELSWRLRKDGGPFLAEVTISPVRDETGEIVGFGQVVRDTTEEGSRLQQIEASAAHLRSILETVPDAMITIDEYGIVESFSAAAEQLFGYRAHEVIGRNVSITMTEADASHHDEYLARYRATGERRIIGAMRRVMGKRKDGSTFPHELYVSEANGGGRRIFTGFVRDLTAREAAEAKLKEVQSELLHMSRVSAVGAMATTLAHELNQPLTAIANYTQTSAAIMARGEDQALAMVREALEETGREAIRAGAIIQRLRDFVARGELERMLSSPYDLAVQACELGAAAGRVRGIECRIEVSAKMAPVLVDRIQIQQVLLNLIRNAIEAIGDTGEIVIGATLAGGMVCFSVIDDGGGIEAGKEETLFEPFFSSKADGMGLGLAICRTIIEAHGGRMWCEQAPSSGAAFYFTVPVAEVVDG